MILLHLLHLLQLLTATSAAGSNTTGDPVLTDGGCPWNSFTDCPAWFLRNSKGDCECGSHLRGVIKCDEVNQVAHILAGFCMSVDNSTNEL